MKKNTSILVLGLLLAPITSMAALGDIPEGGMPNPVQISAAPALSGISDMPETGDMPKMDSGSTMMKGMAGKKDMSQMHKMKGQKDHECMMKKGGSENYHKGSDSYHQTKYSKGSHYSGSYHKGGYFWIYKIICSIFLLGYFFLTALVIRKGWEMGADFKIGKKKK